MNVFERRRVAMALAVTLIALPVMWVINRQSAASSGDGSAAVDDAGTAPPSTQYQPTPPLFVGGDDAPNPPAVIDIAVPPAPSATDILAKASYHRYLNVYGPVCTTLKAPDAAVITVVNVDNGQRITCTNTLGMAIPAGADIVLDTAVFVQIGDLADAPVPVRMSW